MAFPADDTRRDHGLQTPMRPCWQSFASNRVLTCTFLGCLVSNLNCNSQFTPSGEVALLRDNPRRNTARDMPPLGWTKKEAEKRGELGKGRPRAVELRDTVANIAPFEFADDEATTSGGEHGKPIPTESPVTRAAEIPVHTQPMESAAAPAAAPPVRPKIWLRTPSGGTTQLCGSLRKFCQQQELEYTEVTRLLDGQADGYRGWRVGFGTLPPTTCVPSMADASARRVRRRLHG